MASLPNSKVVTYEEWLRMPVVDEAIEEVVNGVIHIVPPPKWKHALIVQRLSSALNAQVDKARILVMSAEFGLIIRKSPFTSRVPDLAVFEIGTIVEQDDYIHSAPQLIVEVLSPANTRRDRADKLADYAELGVPEVWVVAPQGRTVEVLYLEGNELRRQAILAEGPLQPRLFPDVQINIAEIWPD
jgi:Uma2 family endonuclease